MGHEHGSDADPANDVADLAPRPFAECRVEVGQRLVEQEHARLGGQRPRQRDPLLLPAGELPDAAQAVPLEIHQGERPVHPAVEVGSTHPERLEPKRHVGADVEVREERVVLEHHPEAPGHRRDAGHIVTLDQDPTLIRRLEPGEQPERGRLAAAAGPQQCQQLAALERQRHVIDR